MSLDIEAMKEAISKERDRNQLVYHYGFDDYGDLYFGVGVVAALISEVERLRAQVDRVRKLHQEDRPMKTPAGIFMTPCAHCHLREFPCPTIQALEETE